MIFGGKHKTPIFNSQKFTGNFLMLMSKMKD